MTKTRNLAKLITLLHDYQQRKSLDVAKKSFIIQSNKISDALKHACAQTYSVSDLDSTLYSPIQLFGSSIWVDRYQPELIKKHQNEELAEQEVLRIFDKVQSITKVKPVEEDTSYVMQKLAAESLGLLGLTARRDLLREITTQQLESINVQLNHGTIFAAGQPKGPLLAQRLSSFRVLPRRVLYIDDYLPHVECVMKSVSDLGVEVVGIHYTRAHEESFCFDTAEIQRQVFEAKGELLSDAQAKTLMTNRLQKLK